MRIFLATAGILLLTAGTALAQPARSQITCSQIPDAQRFVDGLRPGPNTRAAQRYLDAAKTARRAGDERRCVEDLGHVNYYARRSAEIDRRLRSHAPLPPRPRRRRRVLCADPLHQNRPGGTDYHGPPVPACPRVM